jgi:hypothetical protein
LFLPFWDIIGIDVFVDNMAEQRTLRQLAAPDANYNGLCIEYPAADIPFESKSGLIHLLPRFNGFAGEDPHKHLNEFQVVYSTLSEPSLEDIVKQMAINNLQYQQQIDSTLQTLQTQIGQLASSINAMQQAQGSNQQPMEEHSIFQIELLSETVDDTCTDLLASDFPSLSDFDDVYSCSDCTDTTICVVCAEIDAALQGDIFTTGDIVIDEVVYAADTLDIPAAPSTHSIEQPPSPELKQLPKNLKYTYLESNEKLPVVISSNLDFDQENKFLQVLKKHKKTIGWTLIDIPEISPSMILHRVSIKVEDETKVLRQPLNLLIFDVVENKITCPFDTFTYRRLFFDPGIKGEGTYKNFKFNGHYPKLLHESRSLEEENLEDLFLGKAAYFITYPP